MTEARFTVLVPDLEPSTITRAIGKVCTAAKIPVDADVAIGPSHASVWNGDGTVLDWTCSVSVVWEA